MHCMKRSRSVTFRSSICDLQQVLQDFWAATVLWSIWRVGKHHQWGEDRTELVNIITENQGIYCYMPFRLDCTKRHNSLWSWPLPPLFFLETASHTSGWSQRFGNPPALAPHPIIMRLQVWVPHFPHWLLSVKKLWLLSGFYLRSLECRTEYIS